MVSLKLCVLVVASVIVALATEAECQRRGWESFKRDRPYDRPRGRPWRRPGGRGGFDADSMTPDQQLLSINGLAEATKQFSFSLCRQLKDNNTDNFVFSPLSVFIAFSMVELGSDGRTKSELRSALGVPRAFPLPESIKAYLNSLASEDGNAQALSKLANAMFVRPDFNVKRSFSTQLQRFFKSTAAPFAAVDPEGAINDWIEAKTDGEIKKFLPDGSITTDTVMLLVNAIYFKGKWKTLFPERLTRYQSFSVSETERHEVLMMNVKGLFRVMRSNTLRARVLELPYEGDRYAFYIILPYPYSDLSVVESRLNADTLNSILDEASRVSPSEYFVTIPKFALDAKSRLIKPLQALGAQEVFTPHANLEKIYRRRNPLENFYVSEAVHRSIIELDEEGTVAAGGTGIGFSAVSRPPSFSADRPFVFVLRDNQSGINWFIGRYSNPRGQNLKV